MGRVTVFLALLMMAYAPVAAQSRSDPEHTQSIGAGLLWTSTGQAGTPGIDATWRRWFSPRVGIGADLRWGTSTKTIEIDSPEQPGPGGLTIRAQRGVEHLRTTSRAYGVGILARGLLGRVSLVGGVGPALFVDRSAHETRINDFQDAGESTWRTVGVLGVAEVEVRATRRMSVFAGLRIELRDARDSESLFGHPVAGVRLAF